MKKSTLVFLTCLFISKTAFTQTGSITWNPYVEKDSPSKEDTIAITHYDWELLIFGAFMLQECNENLHDADSIIEVQEDKMFYMRSQLNLANEQRDSLLSVVSNQKDIIDRSLKREKRKRLENGLIKGGMGGGIAALIGLYLWKELSD